MQKIEHEVLKYSQRMDKITPAKHEPLSMNCNAQPFEYLYILGHNYLGEKDEEIEG